MASDESTVKRLASELGVAVGRSESPTERAGANVGREGGHGQGVGGAIVNLYGYFTIVAKL